MNLRGLAGKVSYNCPAWIYSAGSVTSAMAIMAAEGDCDYGD